MHNCLQVHLENRGNQQTEIAGLERHPSQKMYLLLLILPATKEWIRSAPEVPFNPVFTRSQRLKCLFSSKGCTICTHFIIK